jgi:hypothetical protein
MRKRMVRSVPELVDALGGNKAAQEFFGISGQLIWHWRENNRIPARLHLLHTAKLADKGIEAPVQLWGFVQEAAE